MRDVTGFFEAVLRYEIGLWGVLDRDVQSTVGVTLGRLQALRVVGQHEGQARVQDVADGLMITVGAASKLVDRLERDGTVQRMPNPEDRRSSLIALTVSGRTVLSDGEATVGAALDRCVAPEVIADEELASATALLRKLSASLEASGNRTGVEAWVS